MVNSQLNLRPLASCRQFAKQCSRRLAQYGMNPSGRQFGDGLQHEDTLSNAWMRQDQLRWLAQDKAMIIEKIKIERTRPPARGAAASGVSFNHVKSSHQGLRRQMSCDARHGVDEWRLVDAAKRCRQ